MVKYTNSLNQSDNQTGLQKYACHYIDYIYVRRLYRATHYKCSYNAYVQNVCLVNFADNCAD